MLREHLAASGRKGGELDYVFSNADGDKRYYFGGYYWVGCGSSLFSPVDHSFLWKEEERGGDLCVKLFSWLVGRRVGSCSGMESHGRGETDRSAQISGATSKSQNSRRTKMKVGDWARVKPVPRVCPTWHGMEGEIIAVRGEVKPFMFEVKIDRRFLLFMGDEIEVVPRKGVVG